MFFVVRFLRAIPIASSIALLVMSWVLNPVSSVVTILKILFIQ